MPSTQEADIPQLIALGQRLGFTPQECSVPPVMPLSMNSSKDELIGALEDIFSLYDGTNEFEQ